MVFVTNAPPMGVFSHIRAWKTCYLKWQYKHVSRDPGGWLSKRRGRRRADAGVAVVATSEPVDAVVFVDWPNVE